LSPAIVLQADSTTQSALSFSCATSLAVSSRRRGGWLGRHRKRERRLGHALDAGDEAVVAK
jgi:hypothetical protein